MAWNILGNEGSVNFLWEHTRAEKLRHAYLITGPLGSGRRTLALAFVKALNCEHPPAEGEFCGQCLPCRQIESQTFPDLFVLTPPEGARDLRIDQVREMQQTLALSPYRSKYRVVLIPDFQRATAAASNALLKSLEEPPSKALLILTADARESLLETIASRCEVVRMRPLPVGELEKGLVTDFALAPEKARLLAHLSAGRVGYAVRYARDESLLERHQEAMDQLLEQLSSSRRARLQYAERLSKQKTPSREQFTWLVSAWLPFWRDVLICRENASLPLVNLAYEARIQATARAVDHATALSILKAHEEALAALDKYANPRLVFENLLMRLPKLDV